MAEVPTSVGVITCMGAEGVIGCTVSSVVSVSVEADDEKILFALKKGSRIGILLGQGKRFTLSILNESQQDIATSAGGKLKHNELVSFLSEHIDSDSDDGFPIRESRVVFLLSVDQVFETTNSDVFFCKVHSARICGETKRRPLLYFRRSFRKIDEIPS